MPRLPGLGIVVDAIPLIIVSGIINIFNGKSKQEKFVNFILITSIAYFIALLIVGVSVIYAIYQFRLQGIPLHLR